MAGADPIAARSWLRRVLCALRSLLCGPAAGVLTASPGATGAAVGTERDVTKDGKAPLARGLFLMSDEWQEQPPTTQSDNAILSNNADASSGAASADDASANADDANPSDGRASTLLAA